MAATQRVSLILEINIGHDEPMASVHVVVGEYDFDDLTPSDEFTRAPNARKIIGPSPVAIAQISYNAVLDILKMLDCEIIEEETADD